MNYSWYLKCISYSFSELVGLIGLFTGTWEGFLTGMCVILRQLHLRRPTPS